jgi:NADH dehydrogenase
MRILVTGGSGVVGAGTVTELVRRGHSVTLLARHAAADARQWPTGVTPFPGDVSHPRSLHGAADDCDAVLHMVGIVDESDDATFAGVNVGGTANMVAEAERAGVGRFIFVSSLGAPTGASDYHRSKREAEALVRRFHGAWTICRPGNVYGPGDEQISLLLRMVRSPSPVVPRIGDGDQPIQPLWWEDAAVALATVVERPDLAKRELDLAGGEMTSQNDLIARLSRITGRAVTAVSVPDFLATLGARAVSLVGWDVSFNEQQLTMLHEGNAIQAGGQNALIDVLGIVPTPLDDGLRKLADLQQEQLPDEGIGALKQKRYWADIVGSRYDADALFALFRTHFNEITPVFVDVAPEPTTTDLIDEGESLTLALPMRGHVQVRVAELRQRMVTLLTLAGHPLSGCVRFATAPAGAAVRFQVEVYERAANVLDLIAMRAIGDRLQDHTWSAVVENVISLSGGRAPAGVQQERHSLDDEEAAAIQHWLEEVTVQRKRAENAEKIAASG